jgi:hypothetical protein
MNVSSWWNEIWKGKTEILDENQQQCNFVHHKSNTKCSGIESCPSWLEAGDKQSEHGVF